MTKKDCKDCPDRYMRINEDGRWETCHTTCPIYAALVVKNNMISEARSKINDNRTFDYGVKAKYIKIGKNFRRKK